MVCEMYLQCIRLVFCTYCALLLLIRYSWSHMHDNNSHICWHTNVFSLIITTSILCYTFLALFKSFKKFFMSAAFRNLFIFTFSEFCDLFNLNFVIKTFNNANKPNNMCCQFFVFEAKLWMFGPFVHCLVRQKKNWFPSKYGPMQDEQACILLFTMFHSNRIDRTTVVSEGRLYSQAVCSAVGKYKQECRPVAR
jgi:hypothetical protein